MKTLCGILLGFVLITGIEGSDSWGESGGSGSGATFVEDGLVERYMAMARGNIKVVCGQARTEGLPPYAPEDLWQDVASGALFCAASLGEQQMEEEEKNQLIENAIQYGRDQGFPILAETLVNAVFRKGTLDTLEGSLYEIDRDVVLELGASFRRNRSYQDAMGLLCPAYQRTLGDLHVKYADLTNSQLHDLIVYECLKLLAIYKNLFIMNEIISGHVDRHKETRARRNSGHLSENKYHSLLARILTSIGKEEENENEKKEYFLATLYLMARGFHPQTAGGGLGNVLRKISGNERREGFPPNEGLSFMLHGLCAGVPFDTLYKDLKPEHQETLTSLNILEVLPEILNYLQYGPSSSLDTQPSAPFLLENKMEDFRSNLEPVRWTLFHYYRAARAYHAGYGVNRNPEKAIALHEKYLELVGIYNSMNQTPSSEISPLDLNKKPIKVKK